MTRKSRIVLIVVLILILLGAGILLWLNMVYGFIRTPGWLGGVVTQTVQTGSEQVSQQAGEQTSQEQMVASFLNGVQIPQSRAGLPVLAVMVENSPPARPQSGLSRADIVYETLAEGGITRFMAFFQSQEAEILGPVRSVRIYFAKLAREYDAWIAHVGGSSDALAFINRHDLHDLDQFFIDKPYWRDATRMKTRGLEHSMYTDTNELRKLMTTTLPADFAPWSFATQEPPLEARPKSQHVTVNFSFPAFEVEWTYDRLANDYVRSMASVLHKEAQDGKELRAKDVLIQYVKMDAAFNKAKQDYSAEDIQLDGQGDGVLFKDGQEFPVTWTKSGDGVHTMYSDVQGAPVLFNPGLIWIELAAKDMVIYDDAVPDSDPSSQVLVKPL